MRKYTDNIPLAQACGMIDDGLGASDISEATTPSLKHIISGVGMKASNVDVGFSSEILQSSVERLERRAWSGNGWRDRWLSRDQDMELTGEATSLGCLQDRHAVVRHHLRRRRRAMTVDAVGRTVDNGNTCLVGIARVRGGAWSIVLVG